VGGGPSRPVPKKPAPRVGGGGLIGGQDPYKPFENNKIDWLNPDSETAAPAMSRQGGGSKPALFLFIGYGDAEHCCARTFERAVFRDQDVVAFVRENFLSIRLDRSGEVAKKLGINNPSLVMLDCEGEEVCRFVDCSEASLVLTLLKETVTRSNELRARTATWQPQVLRAESLTNEGKTREAATIMVKALRLDHVTKILKEKIAQVAKSLDDKAEERMAAAKAKEAEDAIAAWRLYREVRDDFWGLPAWTRAKAAIVAIEKNPANKDALKAAREAEAKGKKKAAEEPQAPAPAPAPAPKENDPPKPGVEEPPAPPPMEPEPPARDPESDD
jgi:hypothetical protein